MSGIWGRRVQLSLFGESHGPGVGVTLHGLPPGVHLDLEAVRAQMDRRRPGQGPHTSPRQESDSFEILSGLYQGQSTGTPLTAWIGNRDARSRDYQSLEGRVRPGHADYPVSVRYGGAADPRGGGHASGRLTAPLVFAGAICRQILEAREVHLQGVVTAIGSVGGAGFPRGALSPADLEGVRGNPGPVIRPPDWPRMLAEIEAARQAQDSVGGVVECAAVGLPPGLGDPFFQPLESVLAGLLFAIPAVKGVGFGSGFGISVLRGSEANDPFVLDDGAIRTATNHNGGLLGGLTTGMPLLVSVAFKPTPSIGKEQRTVDIREGKETTLRVQGRHDPCIVPRAVVVVESVCAIGLLDTMLGRS